MTEYLVTGGAGFIGSHIAEKLAGMGKTVRIIDNLSTGKIENISGFIDDIEFMEADFTDFETARRAVEGVSYVIHQGAIPSVARSVDDPRATNKANVTGTLNLLVASRDSDVKRFVYASSSSVYGDSEQLPKVESIPPDPISPYALTKLTAEYYCRQFFQLFGLETVSLRYFNVYGPHQNPESKYAAVIPTSIYALKQNRQPVIDGDGEQTRAFTYVGDVVKANLLACEAHDQAAGRVYNVAGQERTSVKQLLDTIETIMGVEVEPIYAPARKGDIRHSYADTSAAEKDLGCTSHTEIEQGLKKTIDWFKDSLQKYLTNKKS